MRMTLKSSQFQGSLRKVKGPTQKPRARIFIRDSKVYIPVNVYLGGWGGGEVPSRKHSNTW